MKPRTTKLECPSCGAAGEKEMQKRMCVSQQPALKEGVLSGAYFQWECPGCEKRFFFEDVFLYNDDENMFMVYLVPGFGEPAHEVPTILKTRDEYDTGNSTLRITASYIDFVEKIRVLQAGLDDRVIEAMKVIYSQAYHQTHGENIYNMIFEQTADDGTLVFAVFLENEDFAVDIPADAYEQTKKDFLLLFGETQDSGFIKIDQEWLAQTLKSADAADE